MALRLVLILLALRIADSASLPSQDHSVDVVDVQDADGRKLDTVTEAEDEPIALLIGKDVKRVTRRKGLSEGNGKGSRRREQHKDLVSHLLESHEWSPRDSGLEHILDPVSLEDPKDIELKKAIAQLLKEVADREEKRRHKQHRDSNEGNIKESDEKEPHGDLNITFKRDHEHHELKESQDNQNDDITIENHDKVHDQFDSTIDINEHLTDTEFHSDSIDADDDLKLNEDSESSERDLDYSEDINSNESRNAQKQDFLKHDEKRIDVYHAVDDDLKYKDGHYSEDLMSKEIIEEETNHEDINISNVTLKKSIDGISEDKSDKLEHDDSIEEGNIHKHHSNEKSGHDDDKKHNYFVKTSHDANKTLKTKSQEVQQSLHHNNEIKTEQKDTKIHKNSQQTETETENSYENISSQENNFEHDDGTDLTQELEEYHESNSRLYSFENYDTINDDSDEKNHKHQGSHKTIDQSSEDDIDSDEKKSKDLGAHRTVDQSSEDIIDIMNSRRSHSDSEAKTKNDTRNDLSSNLKPTNEAFKVNHQDDSIEIVSYRVPQRRYRSQEKRIRESFGRKKKDQIKKYTLSFFLRK